MAKAKFDFQQVLLQHGERIGIGIAGGLAGLLVAMNLFMPGSGFWSGSPSSKAKALETPTVTVNQKLSDPNNLPGDNDKPPPGGAGVLVALKTDPVDPTGLQVKALVNATDGGQLGRRGPKVFAIDEATARFTHMQIQSYIFDTADPPKIYALRSTDRAGAGGGMAEGGPGGRGGAGGRLGGIFGGRGGVGGRMGGMGMGPGMGEGMGGAGGLGSLMEGDNKKDKLSIPIPLEKLDKMSNLTLAEQARPIRMVLIAASFPYKKQVEEFRSKLAYRFPQEVLSETMTETTKEKQTITRNTFRFLGVLVERRELDGDGNPIKGPAGQYKEVDLAKSYRPFIVMTGKRFEEEDPELAPISFDGLVMPRLQQFRQENVGGSGGASGMAMGGGMIGPGPTGPGGVGGSRPPAGGGSRPTGGGTTGTGDGAPGVGAMPTAQRDPLLDKYPTVEKELASIKKTLADLKGKNLAEVARPPSQFSGDNFDIFSRGSEPPLAGGAAGEGTMGGLSAGMPGTGAGRPGTGTGRLGTGDGRPATGSGADSVGPGMGNPNQELELPEHCLVRLIDVTIEPGKIYEYRMKVRMANPNYKRTDVASPDYADKPELLSDWSKTTVKIQLEPELVYYAVDQEQWQREAKERYENVPYRNIFFDRSRMIFLQAHRWLEAVRLKGENTPLLFGEWTVAERLPAFRGEFVGKTERIEAPVWRYTREEFVLAADPAYGKKSAAIGVYFGYAPDETKQPEVMLVDFNLGKSGYRRTVKQGDDDAKLEAPVMEESALEVVLMKPDGKLLLLEGALDYNDEQRIDRLSKVRKRIKDVKDGVKPATGAPGGGTGGTGSGDGVGG